MNSNSIISSTGTDAKCEEGKYPKKLNIFETKKWKTWSECWDLCNEKEMCDYFTWKVI